MSESTNGKQGTGSTGRKNVIDEGTTFKGSLTSSSTVVVMGVMEGEITGPAVEVEPSGVIVGKARITELRSRGELAGEFEADQVELSGKVRDNTIIRARSLLVAPRAGDNDSDAVFGECQIEVGEVPSKEKILEEVLAAARRRSAPAPEVNVTTVSEAATAPPPSPVVVKSVEAEVVADPPALATPPAAEPVAAAVEVVAAAPEGESLPSIAGKRGKRPASERPSDAS